MRLGSHGCGPTSRTPALRRVPCSCSSITNIASVELIDGDLSSRQLWQVAANTARTAEGVAINGETAATRLGRDIHKPWDRGAVQTRGRESTVGWAQLKLRFINRRAAKWAQLRLQNRPQLKLP
jgi:hypothetical protein